MKSIALTGSIACGKSTALKAFSRLSVPTIDCDAIVAELYKKPEIKKKLLRGFGTANKRKLSSITFSSESKRKRLESLLHPSVLKEMKRRIQQLRKDGTKLVVVEVPLLFEASLSHLFDAVVVVKATKRQQTERLLSRGFSRKQARLRINSQLPLKQKVKRADFVIDNTKSVAQTRKQAEKLLGDFIG